MFYLPAIYAIRISCVLLSRSLLQLPSRNHVLHRESSSSGMWQPHCRYNHRVHGWDKASYVWSIQPQQKWMCTPLAGSSRVLPIPSVQSKLLIHSRSGDRVDPYKKFNVVVFKHLWRETVCVLCVQLSSVTHERKHRRIRPFGMRNLISPSFKMHVMALPTPTLRCKIWNKF